MRGGGSAGVGAVSLSVEGRVNVTAKLAGSSGNRSMKSMSEGALLPATLTARIWKAYLGLYAPATVRLMVLTPLLPMVVHDFLFNSVVRVASVAPKFPWTPRYCQREMLGSSALLRRSLDQAREMSKALFTKVLAMVGAGLAG